MISGFGPRALLSLKGRTKSAPSATASVGLDKADTVPGITPRGTALDARVVISQSPAGHVVSV